MLKGQKINLRMMRRKDLETFYELSSDVAARGLFFPLDVHSEVTLQHRFEKNGYWSEEVGLMLIVEKETDEILGNIVHFKPTHYYHAVEIGYILFRPETRGKGVMGEALRLFVGYLFDLMPIHRIQLQVEQGNVASRRVAEKCGFKFEGTARQVFVSRGVPTDIDVFSLIRSEWQ